MKQMSRRGLFGVAAGSALAGPSVAKSALATMGPSTPAPYYGGVNAVTSSAFVPTANDLMRDIANYLGRKDEIEKQAPRQDRYLSEGLTIDGLRSISAPHRARMIAEANARRNKAEELSYVDRRIAELKEQVGVLGYLL